MGGARRWRSSAVAIAILARRRPVGFPLALGFAAIAAGFATATLRTACVAHPVLHFPASSVTLSGFVEIREERERSDRITVRVQRIEVAGGSLIRPSACGSPCAKTPRRAVGSFVELKAHLSPPLAPLRPGGYDFARDMYFQSIGASGYALGKIKIDAAAGRAPRVWLRYAAFIDGIREAIDKRIRAVIPGDEGSIASALITGKRDAISTPVNDAMYISSLAHVLSISGYHMAVVAGIVFFFIRAGLALVPLVREPLSDQEMGGRGRAVGGGVLSAALGRRSGNPALVHHDRDRACRHSGGPADIDVPHDYDRGVRCACCWRRNRSLSRAFRCRLPRRWR